MYEGVYAASGCYTVTTNIHQRPEFGRGDYRIQVNARHDTSHTCSQQLLTLGFNQSVEYSSSNGTPVLTLRVRRLRLHVHIGIIQRITSEWVMLL